MDHIKIGLIFRASPSAWVSCQSINQNLINAYRLIAPCEIFELYSEESVFRTVERIVSSDISVLVIADHQVRLLEIFRLPGFIKFIVQKKIKIVIHVFGCYVDRLVEFISATEELSGQDIHIVAASPGHQRLVRKTVVDKESVHCIPFPLDTNYYSFIEESRQKIRKKLNLSPETPLLLYTGRISAQKNVELCMQLMHEINSKRKIMFIYCGFFDHYEPIKGMPYQGEMSQLNSKLLQALDKENQWCKYQSFLERDDLRDLMCAADGFISLSTTRGEDFGMSVAEAKSMGLTAFLSRWGGYSGFESISDTFYAPIKILKDDLEIDLNLITESLLKFEIPDRNRREEIHQETREGFSIESVSTKLGILVRSSRIEFKGFNKSYSLRRSLSRIGNFETMLDLKDLYEEYCR